MRAEIAGLRATISNRSETIRKQKLQLKSLEESLAELVFESQDHCDVAAVLAFPQGEQIPAVDARLGAIAEVLKVITTLEENQRTANKRVDLCRAAEERQIGRAHV